SDLPWSMSDASVHKSALPPAAASRRNRRLAEIFSAVRRWTRRSERLQGNAKRRLCPLEWRGGTGRGRLPEFGSREKRRSSRAGRESSKRSPASAVGRLR
ncbi:MCM2/3/5 family protein, partial [Toxoplasma gondii TgCatPRC2]